ncbi:MAG TPA: TIM barrel protein [Blastocatellia bacterium]|jgi:hydroxypyruvate isomerase
METMSRREAISKMGAAAFGALLLPKINNSATGPQRVVKNGRLKQSVSWWPYQSRFKLPEFCKAIAEMGLQAIDLLEPKDWETAQKYGLVCSMGYPSEGAKIPDGLNNRANHDVIVRGLEKTIPMAAKMGVPNLIAFFGNRQGRSEAEAIDNCVAGLNRARKVAEDHGVTVCVELLNSKVDHKDYQGDHTTFGLQVIKAVGSPRVRLLYDIYHMQIMEGDIIRTIRDNHEHIAHYHTGGVPGRHEIDDTQELNWRTVCKAIAATGFKGYVAHEFVPVRDPLASLREAIALCDI